MAWYIEDKNGNRKKISGTSLGSGGITEVPIATNTIIGGVISSNNSGSLKVNPTTGESTINDNVTMANGGIITLGDGFDEQYHTIEFTADTDIPASEIIYDNTGTGLTATNEQDAITEVNTKASANATNIETNTQNITKNTANITGIQSTIKYYTNRNLLDNWYFGNLVNQRGQSTYTATNTAEIMVFDRWRIYNYVTATINENTSVTFSHPNTSGSGTYITGQRIEFHKPFLGKTLTLSILTGTVSGQAKLFAQFQTDYTGNVFSSNILESHSVTTLTFTVPTDAALLLVGLTRWTSNTSNIEIIAMKLEEGSVQTLAHQDDDGSWILNESPPNVQQELAKCQRHQIEINGFVNPYAPAGIGMRRGDNAKHAQVMCALPVPLRAIPTVKMTGKWAMTDKFGAASTLPNVTSITYSRISTSFIVFTVVTDIDMVLNIPYFLQANNDATAKILLDANL